MKDCLTMESKYTNYTDEMWENYCLSQENEIKKLYKKRANKNIDLTNCLTFTDKLQWLKLHDSTRLKAKCSDKILVHEYCKEKLGKDICCPIIKIFNNFNDINFEELPENYVIKTNHGSRTNIIVKNRNIDIDKAREQFNEWLSKDWSWWGKEMYYDLIDKKIFVEHLLSDEKQTESLIDYKFWCFNGVPIFIGVNTGHGHGEILNYDMNFNQIFLYEQRDKFLKFNKPVNLNLMKEYAKKLSQDFKFVRVDFYEVNNIVYLGELTFIPGSGYQKYKDYTTDFLLGSMLKLDC